MGLGINQSNPIQCTSLILPCTHWTVLCKLFGNVCRSHIIEQLSLIQAPKISWAVNQLRGVRGAFNARVWPEDSADVPLAHLKDSLLVESQSNTFLVMIGGLNLLIACRIRV